MAITISLYQNYKNVKSTAAPPAAAVSFTDCLLREGCSVQRPVVGINGTGGAAWNPSSYNYAYINSFSRYYWVTDWTWDNGLWWCSLRVDVLTTARGSIGQAELYVLRCSADYSATIIDNYYPITTGKQISIVDMGDPWGADTGALISYSNGCFVVGIASDGGTKYISMLESGLSALLAYLFSDTYATAALGALSITMYPEAKIALDPLQYITSVRYYPFRILSETTVSTVKVGQVSVPVAAWELPNQTGRVLGITTRTLAEHRHPQAAARGTWLQLGPYTNYELYYPPFGLVQLDPAPLNGADRLVTMWIVDAHTGSAVMDIFAQTDIDQSTSRHVMLARLSAQVGIDIPLSHVQTKGYGPMTMLSQASSIASGIAANMVAGNTAGAVISGLQGFAGAFGDVIAGQVPHVSSAGGEGSTAALSGKPQLTITYRLVAADDNADNGRPLCQTRRISTIPGYIVCDPTGFSCGLTEEETAEIHQFMREGFFYA